MEIQATENRFKLSIIGSLGMIILYFIVISNIISLPFAFIIEIPYIKRQEGLHAAITVLGSLIPYVITIMILLKRIRKKHKVNFKISFIKTFNLKLLLTTIILFIGYFLCYQSSIGILTNKIPLPQFIEQAFSQMAINPYSQFILAIIIAPVFEEIMMRGIILEGLLNKYKPVTAIITSSLIFGLIHLNIPQLINAALLGLILGVIYYKTRSLILCIFAHATNNLIGLGLSYTSFSPSIISFFIGAVIFILSGIFLIKGIKQFSCYEFHVAYVKFKD